MTTKVKIAIGVGVLLAAGVAYARTRKRPLTCGPNEKFVRYAKSSDVPNYAIFSETTRRRLDEQVRKYGGVCMVNVTAELDNAGGSEAQGSFADTFGFTALADAIGSVFSEPDKDQVDDNGDPFITQPSQLG